MAKMGSVDFGDLYRFLYRTQRLKDSGLVEPFMEACAKELAARLLAEVVPRTPVGQYPKGSGRTGGTLRRGWTGGAGGAKEYAWSLPVEKSGNVYKITVQNPVPYAPYVEFGHRTRGHRGWVEGEFMLTISVDELKRAAPAVIEKKLEQLLKEVFE